MSSSDSLQGVTAVWTGSPEAAVDLLGALEEAGAAVERLPLIAIGPPADPDRARSILENLERYSWILFTSAQAAQSVRELPPPRGRVAAVGPATEARLREYGWEDCFVPEQNDAEGLAAALANSQERGDVLFVRGDRARRTLPDKLSELGFNVEEVEVYSTRPVPSERALEIANRIAEVADVVIMGSPSGVDALTGAVAPRSLGGIRTGLKWVCLGRATHASLVKSGILDAVYPKKIEPKLFVQIVIKVLKS